MVSCLVTGSSMTGRVSYSNKTRGGEGTFGGTNCMSVETDDLLPDDKVSKSELEGIHARGLWPGRGGVPNLDIDHFKARATLP